MSDPNIFADTETWAVIKKLTAQRDALTAEVESLTTEIQEVWIPSAEKWKAERDALAARLDGILDAIGDPNKLRRVARDQREVGWLGHSDYLRAIATAAADPDNRSEP